jgi:uncharacterized LabA/DUF88 family protein
VTEPRLKIAVFIDFDNIEIGVKSTLNTQFDAGIVLDALKERGEVISKTAYADWKRAEEYSRSLTQHAIKLVQRNLTPGGDKNGADINLALDALELAFTHPHINAFAIVGGDSDFITLVEKLKQYDKKVFVIGGRSFSSVIMQRTCHEFIAYENLMGQARRSSDRGARPVPQVPIAQALPLVKRALEILSEREVTPQLGLLKSTLLQLDSTFSERTYGAGSFRDFADKLAGAGLITIKQAGRSVHVELRDGGTSHVVPEPADVAAEGAARSVEREEQPASPELVEPPGDPGRLIEGVRVVQRVFQHGPPRRWPMYIRNVKQIVRGAEPGFDERRYGYGNIVDLIRACQREGLFRLERDRQGVLRVFPGTALQPPKAAAPVEPVQEISETVIPEAVIDVPAPASIEEAAEAAVAAPAVEIDVEAATPPVEVAAVEEEPEIARPVRRRRPAGAPAARRRAAPAAAKPQRPRTRKTAKGRSGSHETNREG